MNVEQKSSSARPAKWNLEPLPHVRKIIAVASGKGGVGKSTTTVNLAHALAAQGMRVGILDADIYGPSIPLMMGLDNAGQPDVEQNQFIPKFAHDIACMSIGFIAGDQAAIWRGPMVTKALAQMLRNVRWATESEPMDVLMIDMPPGTGDIHISMVQQVPMDGAIVVTTPQEAATRDADKCIQMFKKVKVPLLGIIENMSYFADPSGERHAIFGEGGGAALAATYDSKLLGQLPLDSSIRAAADAGEVVNKISLECYGDIAGTVKDALV